MSGVVGHLPDRGYESEILALVRPFVRPFVGGVGENELCDPRALFEFYGMVDLQ